MLLGEEKFPGETVSVAVSLDGFRVSMKTENVRRTSERFDQAWHRITNFYKTPVESARAAAER